jgi:hypothetical protein
VLAAHVPSPQPGGWHFSGSTIAFSFGIALLPDSVRVAFGASSPGADYLQPKLMLSQPEAKTWLPNLAMVESLRSS